jgi:hypothetical protein
LKIPPRLWRLNNLYHIVDKSGKDVIFKMNWAQRQLYDNLHYLNIILKCRQLGMSTFLDILLLDACLWNDNISAGIIAHSLEDAKEIFKTKIKYPYEHLDPEIKKLVGADTDSARKLQFTNGSAIMVGTSMRSGTLQYLHISEYGKICNKYPDKADEILSGSLNTVEAGNFIFIESTAEGRGGHFFDLCTKAQKLEVAKVPLTKLDFKYHFFPWQKHPDYRIPSDDVVLDQEAEEYFEKLEKLGISVDDEQKSWYFKKKQTQAEHMYKEFPSTGEEAFLVSNEGYFYAMYMSQAREDGRISRVPHEPGVCVDTVWDLGLDDSTVLWFVQKVRQEIRLIDYYECSDEGLAHYVSILHQKRDKLRYNYGSHWLPHDVEVREMSTGKSRKNVLRDLGVSVRVVPKLPIADGIEQSRNLIPRCWFDEKRCAKGITALENYKKTWNDKLSCYSSTPRHDNASHGADAFRGLAVVCDKLGRVDSMTEERAEDMWDKYAMGV